MFVILVNFNSIRNYFIMIVTFRKNAVHHVTKKANGKIFKFKKSGIILKNLTFVILIQLEINWN